MKDGVRSRAFCFTINNPTDDDAMRVRSMVEKAVYIVVGNEVGESGTPHYQGYVYYKNPKAFSALKKIIPRAHISIAKGTSLQNQEYCSKDGNMFLEEGVCPEQGHRTDMDEVRELIQDDNNLRSVVAVAKSMQSIKYAETYLKYFEKSRDWRPEIRWYHGSTGSGKTRTAREWLGEDIYTCSSTNKWFEGYDQHENVLIDDIRESFASYKDLLGLFDRYEYRVECKNGSRQFLAKKIAITCPYHPLVLYRYVREDINQLIRRFDQIILIGDEVKPAVKYVDEDFI